LRQLFLATGGRKRPILLKKSRRNFGPRKSVVDVEIWFAQKTELSWFLRSNAKIQRFLIYRKAALSEADFFNKIGQERTVAIGCYRPKAAVRQDGKRPEADITGSNAADPFVKDLPR